MSITQVLDTLDTLLDNAWSLPLSGGRCVVDAEKVRDLIDDIRINLPTELKQAQAIVSDRTEILAQAKKEHDQIIRIAEERAKVIVSQQEVVKSAQQKAQEILSQTHTKSKEIRGGAQEFSDDLLRSCEDSLIKALSELKTTRQALRGGVRK